MIACDRAGAGPKLLLVHGLGGERRVWEPLWPALTERFDVMTIDLPGFGASPAAGSGEDVSPAGLARLIVPHLMAEEFTGAHVVGNSLGGWVALELARLGAVRSVTALCPAGFWRRPLEPMGRGARPLYRLAAPLVPLAFLLPPLRHRALDGVMVHPERVPYRAAVRVGRAYAGAPGFTEVQNAMRARRLEDDEGIDVPVTLAWAEHDRLVSPERIPFEPTRTVALPDAGHVPMWDVPELLEELILTEATSGTVPAQ